MGSGAAQGQGEKRGHGRGQGGLLTTPESRRNSGGHEELRRAFLAAWGHDSTKEERAFGEGVEGIL